jgi:hypothetical protein
VDDNAPREWHLAFKNHAGRSDRIQVELNFLMRACALPPQELDAVSIGEAVPCRYLVLEIEELFGGKTKAMIDRHTRESLRPLSLFHDEETLCTNCAPNKLGQCGKLLIARRRGGRVAEGGGLLNRFRD